MEIFNSLTLSPSGSNSNSQSWSVPRPGARSTSRVSPTAVVLLPPNVLWTSPWCLKCWSLHLDVATEQLCVLGVRFCMMWLLSCLQWLESSVKMGLNEILIVEFHLTLKLTDYIPWAVSRGWGIQTCRGHAQGLPVFGFFPWEAKKQAGRREAQSWSARMREAQDQKIEPLHIMVLYGGLWGERLYNYAILPRLRFKVMINEHHRRALL